MSIENRDNKDLARVIDEAMREGEEKYQKKLTSKQRNYVKLTAMGETKSGAYRKSYDISPHKSARNITVSVANDLESNRSLTLVRDHIQRAIENYKQYTSGEMYALIAHKYQQIALGEIDASPAQLAALSQLSKEHGFAIERKMININHSTDKTKLKNDLLTRLRTIDEDKTPE